MKRRRFYATEVDGRPAVLDMRTLTVHVDSVADRSLKTDVILVPTQPNIREDPAPYRHEPLIPEEELRKSKEILERFRFPWAPPLTVGDLTPRAEEKRRNRLKEGLQYIRNLEQDLTVGDLTGREPDRRGLDELFLKRAPIEPAAVESAQIDAKRVRRHQEQVDEVLHIRNMLAGGRDERLERYFEKYLSNKPKELLQPGGSEQI